MKNQGVEFSIGLTPVKTDRVTWTINFNGLHYKNTVTRLPEELREKGFTRGNQIMKEGGSIYDFYMVKWAGVNPDNGDAQYWIKNQATGQFELKQSADYESVNSLQYAGSAIPDLQGGFGTTLHFYNFDLALQFSYQLGGKFLDSQYMGLMHTGGNGRGWHTDIRNRWTPENRNTYVWDAGAFKWSYVNNNARPYGSMYAGEKTPDGYNVDASGAWNQVTQEKR